MATKKAALVTGAASGIGAAVAKNLAAKGYALTLLDLDQAGLQRLVSQISAAVPSAQLHQEPLDVRDSAAQEGCFSRHMARYGRLDVCVLSAGIGERGDILQRSAPQPGQPGWQLTLDVDLTAVLAGIRVSAQHMQGTGGTIISIASAGGVFPIPAAPVYAASKAGVVNFTRSVAGQLRRQGIRAMVVCPEFVDTPLVRSVMASDPAAAVKLLGSLDVSLLRPEYVAEATVQLIEPEAKAGTVLFIRQDGKLLHPFMDRSSSLASAALSMLPHRETPAAAAAGQLPSSQHLQLLGAWATDRWPSSYKKVQVHKLSSNFREAVRLVDVPLPPRGSPLPPGQLLLKRVAVGINASDINYTSGRYYGKREVAEAKLPFDSGFETVSVVAAVGPGVTDFVVGQPVATMTYDGFGEWALTAAKLALAVPRPTSDMVSLLTSGLTASIALSEVGHLKAGETVLVTAAAGGTGQFAVQLCKLAGCHVIATCGGADKALMLKGLGVDRVVDYKREQLKDVLRKEYPRGVDVVYEGVGGSMFEAALENLADRGRLIIIGMIGTYAEGWPLSSYPGMCERLLWKSASVTGFFLLKFAPHFKSHLAKLVQLLDSGKLQVSLDPKPFIGVERVADAVDWLHSGASLGKVVVQLAQDLPPSAPSRL